MDIKNDIISSFLGDRLTKMLESGADRITDEISQIVNNRILEYLVAEYNTNYKTKNLLHKVEPIELEKFYQPLYLRKKSIKQDIQMLMSTGTDTIRTSKEYLEIVKTINRANLMLMLGTDTNRISTKHLKYLFNQDKNCITIIGTAGSGKSTLVKYLFVDCIRTKYKIPIKIELRYLNNYNKDLLSFISEEIIKFNKIAEKENIIEKLLNSGKFVFFFDGYDEIISIKKEEITRQISKITKRYNKNEYVITSRPFVNVEMLDNFHNYEICDLEPNEIKAFIRKQFDDSLQELAENIIKSINERHNNDAYKSFLTNPLLLSMFILTYEKDSYIPNKKCEYYSNVFNALFSGYDTLAKFGYVREKASGLIKEDFINLLKLFSAKSYFEQKYSFSVNYFDEEMKKCKVKLGLNFDTGSLLDDLKVAIGILTEEGLQITYPHRSLQEYFAALFVTSLAYENKLQFYKKLCELFKHEKFETYEFENFFSLLIEMDKIVFQKQFEIPVLKYIKQRIQDHSLSDIDITILYKNTKSINFSMHPLLGIYLLNISIELSIMKNNGLENVFYRSPNERLSNLFCQIDFGEIISKIEEDIIHTEKKESEFIEDMNVFAF